MAQLIQVLFDFVIIPSWDFPLDRMILIIAASISAIVLVICLIRRVLNHTNYTIPQQLVQLIRQAHDQQDFRTRWNIQVSDEMRIALCQPLTPRQLIALNEAGRDVISREVSCYLISHRKRRNELTGVVRVSIRIASHSGNCDFHCPEAKLRLTVSRLSGFSRWELTEVQPL